MKILVAMSGGIDSSVVAHLLKEQGHEVIGVRFHLWSDPLAPALAQILPSKCCTTQNMTRAKNVADKLGIPLHILNLEEEFKREVVDPFLKGYREGLTPNPCIGCNRTIKFGRLLELAKELGCEKLATGHYARVAMEGNDRYLLLEAIDKTKDQSYYLYGLTQEQLAYVIFPLGNVFKKDTYTMAEYFGIPFEHESYRESQDLCFFPEKNPKAFLKRHLKDLLRPGSIVRRDGTVVGKHYGLPLYTIGQRHGLNIGGLKIPLEIVQKNYSINQIVVAEKWKEKTHKIHIQELQWISWKPSEGECSSYDCRLRSLSPRKKGLLSYRRNKGTFEFSSPQPPQAPGQHIVLYRGEEIIGGGVIA